MQQSDIFNQKKKFSLWKLWQVIDINKCAQCDSCLHLVSGSICFNAVSAYCAPFGTKSSSQMRTRAFGRVPTNVVLVHSTCVWLRCVYLWLVAVAIWSICIANQAAQQETTLSRNSARSIILELEHCTTAPGHNNKHSHHQDDLLHVCSSVPRQQTTLMANKAAVLFVLT